MPMLRINAAAQGLRLNGSPKSVNAPLARVACHDGPVVIMIHGFKYSPFVTGHCPHQRIFHDDGGWPQALDLAQRGAFGIAFGWHARGGLHHVYKNALAEAQGLARIIARLRGTRPVHLIAHSLGASLALAALPYLRAGDVGRIVLLSGAAHLGLARHALATPSGRTAELIHVTSCENDLFDFAFEQLIPGSGAIGRGIGAPQAVRLQIDCARTLGALSGLGYPLAPPTRSVCHWSSYTRPGVMALNADLVLNRLSLERLRAALPPAQPRWSRLPTLVLRGKTRIMPPSSKAEGNAHGHAY